jgi:tRNA threonylcarbamoyladenosine biosynthesis protein TsaE
MFHPRDYLTLSLADEFATIELGKKIAAIIHPGLTIFLSGNLGAGKTTLVRGVLRGLGYVEKVKSPTYNLIEVYKISKLYLYHFDFYRFNDPFEWEEAGFREYFNTDSICFVEWPERAGGLLPAADLSLFFEILGTERVVKIYPGTEAGNRCLEYLSD